MDDEIIKTLRTLLNVMKHEGISRIDITADILENTINLINRQKSDIENLEIEYEKVYEQIRTDILGNMADGGTSCHWCIDQHKAEAIKEFAERLIPMIDDGYVIDIIDNLVKEMVGE